MASKYFIQGQVRAGAGREFSVTACAFPIRGGHRAECPAVIELRCCEHEGEAAILVHLLVAKVAHQVHQMGGSVTDLEVIDTPGASHAEASPAHLYSAWLH